MDLTPVTLEGKSVCLVPLTEAHHAEICEASLSGDLFRYFPDQLRTAEDMKVFIHQALEAHRNRTALPFATVDNTSGKVIGGTRFGNISHRDRRVEIGWTWLGKAWQRTAANTEAKLLMLRHAFETWECGRVELKTDSRNEQSRKAILRVGATQEGVLRRHMVMADGYVRDTVYFSILREEWPAVRERLHAHLDAFREPFLP